MLAKHALLLLLAALAQDPPATAPADGLGLRDSRLELLASSEPLTGTTYQFEHEFPLLGGFAPATARASYGADAFRPFLPPERAPEVGQVWRLDATDALPFLRQIHPGATAALHHDLGAGTAAPGAWACLRALDAQHAEVLFRVHAEFLLEGDGAPERSTWLTPAQFRGRMAIDRARGTVVGFELSLPDAPANVDMNVATAQGVLADIGRIPRLEVEGGSFPTFAPDASQVDDSEAEALLARKFYPFAEVEWLDLPAARAASLATGKPLHVVALFGSLTDESC